MLEFDEVLKGVKDASARNWRRGRVEAFEDMKTTGKSKQLFN